MSTVLSILGLIIGIPLALALRFGPRIVIRNWLAARRFNRRLRGR